MNIIENRKPLGIYVHIPFCLKKCSYCDFLSATALEEEMEQYFLALKKEITAYADLAFSYSVQSIFFGGGTPTFPLGEWLAQIFFELQRVFFIEEGAEITIECNPETVDLKKLQLYRKIGINRISFGLQSTEDHILKKLGRVHNYQRFLTSFLWAREAGFSNCNIDLMFGLPSQTLDGWEDTLRKVTALEPEHISAYSLIVEEGTLFFDEMEKGQLLLPGEEEEYKMYEKTVQHLEEAGYRRYEVSNYAKKGKECRHNLIYWSGKEYLGLGLGASSYINGIRLQNTTDFKNYLENSRYLERLYIKKEQLTKRSQIEEFMFLGLRKMAGISKAEFQKKFGYTVEQIYKKVLEKWEKSKLLEEDENRIWLTQQGILVSNVILADFLLEESEEENLIFEK